MSYKIVYDKPALKFIQKQPPAQQQRIVEAVHRLPFEGDVKTHGRAARLFPPAGGQLPGDLYCV